MYPRNLYPRQEKTDPALVIALAADTRLRCSGFDKAVEQDDLHQAQILNRFKQSCTVFKDSSIGKVSIFPSQKTSKRHKFAPTASAPILVGVRNSACPAEGADFLRLIYRLIASLVCVLVKIMVCSSISVISGQFPSAGCSKTGLVFRTLTVSKAAGLPRASYTKALVENDLLLQSIVF